ncbi:transporter [Actinoplanes sp. TBRC 11911]|uniref:SLAC1 family transporter n=1 Tax=Actinoplanes sp. TBRC 11911 TaxID=2729386 RepID=UPI00145D4D74|nr:transporter [Actinoplanes sp. TBRC 11911]NMO51096.1 transporter [Actinoplanes sp. TBRC 11911]
MNRSDVRQAPATTAVTPPPTRLPLNTLAVAFGLAGLAGIWSVAADQLGAPEFISTVLWVIVGAVWLGLMIAHTVRGSRTTDTLADQLRHPAQGPIAALLPVVGMLVGAQVHRVASRTGLVIVVFFVVVAAGFAAWMLAHWVDGNLRMESVHGGYFLPTVAGGYIAAGSLAHVGLPELGYCAFAVGTFFWLVIGTLILTRVAVHQDLPAPLVPTLAIFVAPPAVGGSAWFALAGMHSDLVAMFLAGITTILALMQVALLPRYLRLSFSLGFWSFTFPYAAVARFAVEWLGLEKPAEWKIWAWAVVLAISAFIVVIAVRSVALIPRPAPRPR